ncbi:MAG TPA: hypothetical protein VFB78_00655 [Acidimicrobiales bacterium]|nr:hypothetical protein [Acidimicrobiales bacterium]
MRWIRLAVAGLLVLAAIGFAAFRVEAAQKDVHVVNTVNPTMPYAFSPATQAVNAGDTVQWINDTGTDHRAVANDGASFDVAIDSSGGASGPISGPTRDIAYHCSIHPYMTGTIHVTATTTTAKATTTVKPTTSTSRPTSTSRATTTSTATITTDTLGLDTTTSEDTTSTTGGQVSIKTGGGGTNGAAVALLIVGILGVLGGGGYAIYRLRSGRF